MVIISFIFNVLLASALLIYFTRYSEEKSSRANDLKSISNALERQKLLVESINKIHEEYKARLKDITDKNSFLISALEFEKNQYSKLLNQKKSSEVKVGLIAEQMAPFLNDFPVDPKTCCFIGKPIDFISFGEEKITFIEVKSGDSQLNSSQRNIRDQIKDLKVEFITYRVK